MAVVTRYVNTASAAGGGGQTNKTAGSTYFALGFDNGTGTDPTGKSIREDGASPATGVVDEVILHSGSWGTDAKGILILTSPTGTWSDNDVIEETDNTFIANAFILSGDAWGPNEYAHAYNSLSAWEAAEEEDLVTAGDTHTVICAGGADTTVCDINGWTTGVSNFITVTVDSASRHDGTPQTGYHIIAASGNNLGALVITEQYTVVEWLDVENTTASGATTCAIDVRAGNVDLKQVIAGPANDMAVRANPGFVSSAYAGFVKLINCLLHSSEFGVYSGDDVRERYRAYNCTAANNSVRGFSSAATNIPEVINCIAYNNTTEDFQTGTYTLASDYNASSDTSAQTEFGATNSINSITSGFFVDAANDDMHLTASATSLHNAGTDISAYTTIDIDNLSRDATPSIGYHEYVSGGAGLGIPIAAYHHRNNIGSNL